MTRRVRKELATSKLTRRSYEENTTPEVVEGSGRPGLLTGGPTSRSSMLVPLWRFGVGLALLQPFWGKGSLNPYERQGRC